MLCRKITHRSENYNEWEWNFKAEDVIIAGTDQKEYQDNRQVGTEVFVNFFKVRFYFNVISKIDKKANRSGICGCLRYSGCLTNPSSAIERNVKKVNRLKDDPFTAL